MDDVERIARRIHRHCTESLTLLSSGLPGEPPRVPACRVDDHYGEARRWLDGAPLPDDKHPVFMPGEEVRA